ncbi:hypothetical protein ALTERO38_51418 [Alteromonas sp. 38]|nr:hypothetical protein ALTER154_70601 [Alteromonas sp. 154]VXB72211.1 hypothetical protein ALTERO38_51418 [Alteromonas sp. 38]
MLLAELEKVNVRIMYKTVRWER